MNATSEKGEEARERTCFRNLFNNDHVGLGDVLNVAPCCIVALRHSSCMLGLVWNMFQNSACRRYRVRGIAAT